MRVLLLGGTAEARELAGLLVADGVEVETSLAGRVRRPRLPVGGVRVGGFGGARALATYAEGFDAVVDATHPFAAVISERAALVPTAVGVPLLRLQRPGWGEDATAGWHRVDTHWVETHAAAATTAARLGRRPFLTTGRQRIADFVPALGGVDALVRMVDEPDPPLPPRWTLLLARGPYRVDDERRLMREHAVDVLVTKDSGGTATRPKLDAAAALGVTVVVVRRPPVPDGVETVADADAALAWVRELGAR